MRPDLEPIRESIPAGGFPLARREVLSLDGFRIYTLEGTLREPANRSRELAPERNFLSIGLGGTIVLVTHGREVRVMAGENVIYFLGPSYPKLHFARGHHRRIEMEWVSSDLSALDRWVRKRAHLDSYGGHVACVNLKGLDKHYLEDILWTQERIKESGKDTEPAVLACALDLVGAAMTASSTSFLADIVGTAPEALKGLMVAVKKDPTGNWSLRDAAAFAGYSPFHLSRTFRTVVDFGFPEFVDRCRAELAIDRLLKTDLSIDEVASACGFGSTQALREAFKEYLGMLPSEIRSIPVDEYQGR